MTYECSKDGVTDLSVRLLPQYYDATAIPCTCDLNPVELVIVPLLVLPFGCAAGTDAASHCGSCFSFPGLSGGESIDAGGEGYESTGD